MATRPAAHGAGTPVVPLTGPPRIADLSRDELIELLEARGEGGIRIDFSGKGNARKLARRVRPRVARTIKKYSVGSGAEQARNLVIEGDNLQAMATLFRERGQVDLILTDPPYNTGNDWRYNDRWEEDPNDPGIGEWVREDDGARHTKWMRFMWPRLQMMKSMLKPSGVLAICIDYREMFRLGQMLDELFGEANRLGIINWQKSYAPRADNRHVSTATEYVLVYAKDEERAETVLLPRSDEMDARYKSPDGDPRLWKAGDASGPKAKTHQGMVFAIQSPFTGELFYPPQGKCWRDEQKQILVWLQAWGCEYELKDLKDDTERAAVVGVSPDDVRSVRGVVLKTPLDEARAGAERVLAAGPWPRIFFGLKGQGRPQRKNYLEDVKQGKVPVTFWADEDFYLEPHAVGPVSWTHDVSGHSQTGINELDAIVGDDHGFETVKPLRLFERIIQIWCPRNGLAWTPSRGRARPAMPCSTSTPGWTPNVTSSWSSRAGQTGATPTLARSPQTGCSGSSAGTGIRVTAMGSVAAIGSRRSIRRSMPTPCSAWSARSWWTLIASHFDAAARRRDALVNIPPDSGYKYLVAKNADDEGFFLIWNGTKGNTDFTETTYEACAKEAKRAGLVPRYHVYARLYRFQTSNVVFYQIPDRILMDFGLDLRGEPYHADDES